MIIAWGIFIFCVAYVLFLLSVIVLSSVKKIDMQEYKSKMENHCYIYGFIALCCAQYIWG